HTRLQGDWSSDVCSSDLCDRCGSSPRRRIYLGVDNRERYLKQSVVESLVTLLDPHFVAMRIAARSPGPTALDLISKPGSIVIARSEERRVGKEGRKRRVR